MTKKLKNHQVAELSEVLSKLSEKETKNIRAAYSISKIVKSLKAALSDLEDFRTKLVQDHARKDQNGEFMHPELEGGGQNKEVILLNNPDEFGKAMADLMSVEVEINFPVELTLDTLEDAEIQISPKDLSVLDLILS